MKPSTKLAFCFSLSALFLGSCGETISIDPLTVEKLTIHSSNTGTTYPVYVVLPEDYDPANTYKTMYVLDGDDELEGYKVYKQVGSICGEESARFSKKNLIVVAIGSVGDDERFRDYAPVAVSDFPHAGGSENYADFFEFELIPRIEADYPVDVTSTGRVLAGHSLGGTFAGYMFTKRPSVFTNYLMLSPAFWWGDGAILDYESESRTANSNRETLVFVGCGELEEGIRILAIEWHYRLKTFYLNCAATYHMEPMKAHLSSAGKNLRKGIAFYFQNEE